MIFGLRVILCGAGGLEDHGSLGHQHHAEKIKTKNHTSLEVKCQGRAPLPKVTKVYVNFAIFFYE